MGTLWCSIKKIEAPYVFNWEYDIALHEMQEIKPHLPASGMCHVISRVAAGTWGIFSSYSRDGHSKLHFVQRSQDSCLVTTDTSRSKTSLERIIQMLFEVRWETTRLFLVLRKILGFLSIFKKSQASSPLKH